MKEAKEGYGCDRHLMGLSILSSQAGKGSFINDVMKLGGGGRYFCDNMCKGLVKKSF